MSTAFEWGCPGLKSQILFNINLSGPWVTGALYPLLWEKNLIESKFVSTAPVWLLPGVCSLASMTSSKSLSALKNLDSSYNLFLTRDGHTASVSLQH